MPNIDITDDITDVIPDGGTVDVDDESTPDQPIDSDVDDDAERDPDDYDQTDAEDMGTGGDPIPPDSTPPAEELPEPVLVPQTVQTAEYITDYSASSLAEYEQSGAVPYAVYDDGTERQVAWADVSDPSPAGVVAVNEAAGVAAATSQHFWQNSDDPATFGGAGVHVTDDEKDAWVQAVAAGFPDIATKPWHNILINSLGILLRTGLRNLVSITKSAIAFFDGTGNAASNIVARFGADGAQIGKSDESHMELDYHSLKMMNKEVRSYFHASDLRDRSGANSYTVQLQPSLSNVTGELMTIGAVYDIGSFNDECTVLFDGEPYTGTVEPIYDDPDNYFASVFGWKPIVGVTVGESVTGQYDRWTMLVEAENPFEIALTFGERNPDKITAGGSSVFGSYCEASGFNAIATGMITKAIGAFSKAAGIASKASGLCAESSGYESSAFGNYAHAEGFGAYANGANSHAQNLGTIASSDNQTVIGRYNIEDKNDTYALIVGNGSAAVPKNALAVQWNGTIDRTTAGVEIGATRDEILWNNLIRASDSIDGFTDAGHVHLREVYGTAGEYSAQLEVTRVDTTAGTVHNGVRMQIDNDGKRVVYVSDAAAWRRALGMPAGIIQMYAGATAPSGWLWCNGQAVSRTTYAELFAAIGTTWGAGNGSTTFNVPDLRGRTPIGAGQGSGLTNRTLGGKVGSETHTLNADQMPAHTHGSKTLTGGFRARHYGTSGDGAQLVFTPSGIVDVDAKTGTLGKVNAGGVGSNGGYEQVTVNATHTHDSVGGGQAHNNMQPSAVVNFIISAGVTS